VLREQTKVLKTRLELLRLKERLGEHPNGEELIPVLVDYYVAYYNLSRLNQKVELEEISEKILRDYGQVLKIHHVELRRRLENALEKTEDIQHRQRWVDNIMRMIGTQ